MKNEMHTGATAKESSPERVNAFSDGVFAIIITIMVLDLKKPEEPTFAALARLWPTWISYFVSYLFIAIVWINHHFLSKYIRHATPRVIWANFGHMFAVGLIPFLTAWMAETKLAPLPVALYAFVFLLVNITYQILVHETFFANAGDYLPGKTRHLLHRRSKATLLLFGSAMVISFWFPYAGFAIITFCLVLYTRPGITPKHREKTNALTSKFL